MWNKKDLEIKEKHMLQNVNIDWLSLMTVFVVFWGTGDQIQLLNDSHSSASQVAEIVGLRNTKILLTKIKNIYCIGRDRDK